MSKFKEGASVHFNPAQRDVNWAQHLALEFPELTEALLGDLDFPKTPGSIPALTLMVFAKDGTLRFSLSCRDYPRSFFGTVKDPLHVLESIELALGAQEGEWFTKRQDKR